MHSPHGWLQAPGYLPIGRGYLPIGRLQSSLQHGSLAQKAEKRKKNLIATEAGRAGTYLRIQNMRVYVQIQL